MRSNEKSQGAGGQPGGKGEILELLLQERFQPQELFEQLLCSLLEMLLNYWICSECAGEKNPRGEFMDLQQA